MKIYISGPITNNPNYREDFQAAAEMLKAKGHTVLDPTVWVREGIELAYSEYMELDIAMLKVCDTIYLLPGWQESNGAKYEYSIARELGLNILIHVEK